MFSRGLLGHEDGGAEEVGLVFEVRVPVSAAALIECVGRWVHQQGVGELVGDVAVLAPGHVRVV